MQKGAREPDSLAFPSRECVAEFSHGRVVALGERADELVHGRLPACLFDFLVRRILLGNQQVLLDSAPEEVGVLGDERFEGAQV